MRVHLERGPEQHAVFERALEIASEGMAQLERGLAYADASEENRSRLVRYLADEPAAAGIYFWSAVYWGLWSRHAGPSRPPRRESPRRSATTPRSS